MNKDTSGPAFPQPMVEQRDSGPVFASDYSVGGMTLRQWYAGMAMQGAIASNHWNDYTIDQLVEDAFRYADAMLAQEDK